MSDEGTPRRPRRPLHFGPDAMEAHGGSIAGPAEAAEAAHAAAATLVGAGREGDDPQRAARLVRLVEDVGLDTLADLWAQRPARSLPGVLWRLYVLRAWVWRAPSVAAREYAEGMGTAEVQHVVAGMAEPPGPDEVRDLADQILSGLFTGDLGYSVASGTPVVDLIVEAAPHTLALAAASIGLAIVVALATAYVATLPGAGALRSAVRALPSFMVSLPGFWIAILLLQFFSFRLGWVNVVDPTPLEGLILPTLTLAVPWPRR